MDLIRKDVLLLACLVNNDNCIEGHSVSLELTYMLKLDAYLLLHMSQNYNLPIKTHDLKKKKLLLFYIY